MNSIIVNLKGIDVKVDKSLWDKAKELFAYDENDLAFEVALNIEPDSQRDVVEILSSAGIEQIETSAMEVLKDRQKPIGA